MQANITPVSVWPGTASVLSLGATQIVGYGDQGAASVMWYLLSADGAQLQYGQVSIQGADYAGWGADDAYLLAVVAAQLGLTII